MIKNELTERCKNCLTELPDGAKYCYHCGQKRVRLEDHSVWHLMVESVGDFFHLDSKFIATLWPLLLRPGFLTNEFLAGRRARYFQPFKLFLFISFLYFLTSGLLHRNREDAGYEQSRPNDTINPAGSVIKSKNYNLTLNEAYTKAIAMPDDSLRELVKKEGMNHFVTQRYPGASWWAKFMIKQVIRNRLQGSESFSDNMHKTIPKLIFILVPFFALLLKLLYSRKMIPYYNHVIFSFHLLSLYFMMSWILAFISLMVSWIGLISPLVLMLYLFVALRRVYREKSSTTLWKFLVFLLGSVFVVLVFLFLAVTISFIMI
jgi:hypothetical protein